MSEIKFICMSDLHLGDKYSLLTRISEDGKYADTSAPSKTLKALAACLKEISASQTEKPSLVLIGDALELALARTHEALATFELFIKEMLLADGSPPFERIIFIPGNHDHHLWEATRETRYTETFPSDGAGILTRFEHTSPMFCNGKANCEDFFLSRLLKSGRIKELNVEIPVIAAYPEFAIKNDSRCIIMTHGHYIEPLYRAMSELDVILFPDRKGPRTTEDLERQNFAWIDFFWSSMGRQGEVGEDVERIYYNLKDREELRKYLINLLSSLSPQHKSTLKFVLSRWPARHLADGIIESFLNRERNNSSETISDAAINGLYNYVDEFIAPQCSRELGNDSSDPVEMESTLIFGHTHSPFAQCARNETVPLNRAFKKFTKTLKVYNTGGWVVENAEPNYTHGASLVLIDAELNCAAIEMFMEKADGQESPVQVYCAEDAENVTAMHCMELIKNECFARFAKDTAFAIKDRMDFREKFAARIKADK